ncbi:hypothetical protein V473_23260 [Sphingobium cupriresistens LL01]|uniref:Uncharacterized protein n=2 Tax=Sphingobium cupriresistens TaxID=1132417 RepID=A0A0J7XIT7_9SPHN|nr:hypothetical protein V473_23260 [Sphingobium cupriresistens LL01]
MGERYPAVTIMRIAAVTTETEGTVGESKRKSNDLKVFVAGLTSDEKTTYDLAQRLLKELIKPKGMHGACYRVSVLLNRILSKEYGVTSEVVLGWINDGDDIFISHAWLNVGGKKVDLMAERPMHEESDRGPTIILDHVFKGSSNITYSYHLHKTEAALAVDAAMAAKDPGYREMLRIKDTEHAKIAAAIASDRDKDAFLDEAAIRSGDGYTYARILSVIGR